MKQFIILILLLITSNINSQSWINWIDTNDETNHQLILGSINGYDTVTIIQQFDIITIVPDQLGEYKIISNLAEYPIALLGTSDTKSFIFWLLEFPLDLENKNPLYSQIYYNNLLMEKIWE